MKISGGPFHYDNQNFFQLASIQSASLGFSGIIIGKELAQQYGAGTTICSMALGNLILWLIAIAVISMIDKIHSNAIENFKSYFGKYGGMAAAFIFIFALLNWYALQINSSMKELNALFQFGGGARRDLIIRFGAVLGLLSALLSIGGIRLLKRLTVISMPFFIIYHFYLIGSSNMSIPLKGTWGLSGWAVLASVLTLLPGVISFPTFFRHSRSKAHSFFALTLLTVFITFFELSTIWINFSPTQASFLYAGLIALFVVLITVYCNIFNIYLASACLEMVNLRFGGSKGFAILGLLSTLAYTFIQISAPVRFLQDLTNAYLACLGVVLLLACLIKLIVRHRPRTFQRSLNIAAWLFGCIFATIYEVQHFLDGGPSVLVGINACILFFIFLIFLEETIWATGTKIEKGSIQG